jgi:hypothetical protein
VVEVGTVYVVRFVELDRVPTLLLGLGLPYKRRRKVEPRIKAINILINDITISFKSSSLSWSPLLWTLRPACIFVFVFFFLFLVLVLVLVLFHHSLHDRFHDRFHEIFPLSLSFCHSVEVTVVRAGTIVLRTATAMLGGTLCTVVTTPGFVLTTPCWFLASLNAASRLGHVFLTKRDIGLHSSIATIFIALLLVFRTEP